MDLRVLSVLGVLMAGGLLAGCLGEADFSEEVPVWEPGFAWAYDQTAVVDVGASISSSDGGDTDSTVVEMLLTSRYEVLNADAVVGGEPAYLVATETGLRELRIDDRTIWAAGDPLPDDPEVEALLNEACAPRDCQGFAWFTVADVAFAETPDETPQLVFDFPLAPGKTWQVGGVTVNDKEAVLDARAVRVEDLAWSGGRERAVRVETTMDSGFANAIRREMKDQAGDADVTVSVGAHGTSHFAPAMRNVLTSDLGVAIRNSVKTDDQTMVTHVTVEFEENLVDHVLDPKPSRTMDEYLAGKQQAPLPPAEPWPFAITASATSVDAGAAEEVTFSVAEASQIEPGATVRWTHAMVDATGPREIRAKGESYSATITDPGRHSVLATVHDANGALRGAAGTYVAAFTRLSFAADGVLGATVLDGEDPGVGFFVAPGWSNMTITVAPDGVALGTLNAGPTGGPVQTIEVSPLQDRYEVTVTEAFGPFNVTWSDSGRVLDAGFTVEVHYGPSETEIQTAALGDAVRVLRETGMLDTVWRN